MLKQFESNIIKKQLFTKTDKLLLAISGGADSTVLAHLLKKSGYKFALAHCNYRLRGKESEKDQAFCEELAKQLKVKIFVMRPDVEGEREKKGSSIQMAARDLRYDWFEKLMKKEKFDLLLTAHHANDQVETFFINLIRGTGINGLKGMAEKAKRLARPLLIFHKEEILDFAKQNKIKYRIDQSNFEDKYQRNFIRLNILPLFNKVDMGFEKQMQKNISHLAEEAGMVREYLEGKRKDLMKVEGKTFRIDRRQLRQEKYLMSILHTLLNPIGFNTSQCEDIRDVITGEKESGQKFFSENFILYAERNDLIIEPSLQKFEVIKIFRESDLDELVFLRSQTPGSVRSKSEFIVDPVRLEYPLTIRPPSLGDRFHPFGMKGSKLVSDFLKDEKVNHADKKKVKLLVNGNGEIMWVMGYRSDERYRVNTKKKYLKFKLLE